MRNGQTTGTCSKFGLHCCDDEVNAPKESFSGCEFKLAFSYLASFYGGGTGSFRTPELLFVLPAPLSLSPLFFWRRVTFPISSTDLGLPRPLHNRTQSVPSLDNGVVVGLSLRKRITLRAVSFPGSSFSNCPFPRHEIQSILASPSLGLGTVAFQSSELQILRFTTQINIISRWGRQNVEFRNHVGSFAFGALQQLPIYLGLFFT